MLFPGICQSVCLSVCKAVCKSCQNFLLMYFMFHISLVQFFDIIKKKSTQNICLLSENLFFPDLPNLGTQIRCAQNWYIAVKTSQNIPWLLTHHSKLAKFFSSYFEKQSGKRELVTSLTIANNFLKKSLYYWFQKLKVLLTNSFYRNLGSLKSYFKNIQCFLQIPPPKNVFLHICIYSKVFVTISHSESFLYG